ncbi:MAG: MMPL family transporter [bacterium]|nr:MMPL family transporter [bacterium]
MNKYLDFVINRPFIVIAAAVIITIVLGLGFPKLEFESSLDSVMPKKDPEYILNEKMKKIYGNNGKFIVLCATTDNAMEPAFLKKIDNLHYDIEEYQLFNKLREETRMEKFNSVLKGEIMFSTLLELFNDDPAFQRVLTRKSSTLLGTVKPDDILSMRDLANLKRSIIEANEIKKQELIDVIISPFSMKDLVGEDETLTTYELVEDDDYGKRKVPATQEEIQQFKERLTNNPMFEKGIYARDLKTKKITDFGIMIRLNDSFIYDPIAAEMEEIGNSYAGLNIVQQGIPVMYRAINNYMKRDLIKFIPLVLLVVIVVFFLNFRSIRGVILPFITLSLADIWVLGLMGHLGYKLTVIGISLPPLMIAVGSSYAIHILNQYYIDFDDIAKQGKKEGLKKSMSHISQTVALAGVTTFTGFIMLLTNQVSAIKEWGVFSAIGVAFAVIISISLIPAVLVLLPHKNPKGERKQAAREKESVLKTLLVDRIIALFTYLTIHHYRKVVLGTLVVLVAAIVGMMNIEAETSIHAYFKKGDPMLTSSKYIGEKFGGAFGLNILFDSGEKGGAKNPEFLKTIEEFRTWLEADENIDLNIGRTDAFPDFIKTMHLAMNNNDKEHYSIPDKKIDVESYINMYMGDDENDDGRIDDFEPYVDKHYQVANIFARVWEKQGHLLSSADMDHLISKIKTHLDKTLPKKYSYKTSGEPKIIVQLTRYVVRGQIMSLLFSLLVVSIMVILLFRNFKAGLVSIIPIGIAVTINFGVMGWFGIKLDMATAVIASITIGIGIDDTIHFLNTFKYFRGKNYSIDETISRTIAVSGKAIIYTSAALIFGFLILSVSNFNPIVLFGKLVALTMIATTIGALLVLPSVIKATGVSLEETESGSLLWKYQEESSQGEG